MLQTAKTYYEKISKKGKKIMEKTLKYSENITMEDGFEQLLKDLGISRVQDLKDMIGIGFEEENGEKLTHKVTYLLTIKVEEL